MLGDGRQRKSYLYVQDCVDAILTAVDAHAGEPGMQVYNLGTDESIDVDESIGVICRQMGVSRCSSTRAAGAAGPATAR